MSKKKKILLSILSVFCAVVLAMGGFFAIREYVSYAKIHFTVQDTLPDGQGKKATIILLGGQSNASGCSRDDYLLAPGVK